MGRRKQLNPMQRIPSGEVMQEPPDVPEIRRPIPNGHTPEQKFVAVGRKDRALPPRKASKPRAGILQLLVCVGGIYASFLSWGILQERITTTPYAAIPTTTYTSHPHAAVEHFRFPVVLNTIQSFFAAISGTLYLASTSLSLTIFPSKSIVTPLLLVSITSSLASPFGYASLAHVDYLTYVLAKSCKLLPVMALHVLLFGRRYAISKYLVVLGVTAGVVIFTLYQPSKKSLLKTAPSTKSSIYGLSLLGVNLLFDGLTNTIQDHIFSSPGRYGRISGPQMMVAQNIIATLLTTSYLLLTPLVPSSALPSLISPDATTELSTALAFLRHHPSVLTDVLAFAACGAIGQLFIYATLERFSSILLVTVTVTRKMLTMILSLVWFGKRLSAGQWGGVGLVFGGVGAEGWLNMQEKKRKQGRNKGE